MNTRIVGHIADTKVYIATLTPPACADLLFVSTYDTEDPESNAIKKHGYQRPPTEKRFAEIANYFLANGHRFLITPLIVSVRLKELEDIEKFNKLLNDGDIRAIKETFGEAIASIVDGQHRFKGLLKAWESDREFLPEIPVMLYFGLDFVGEAELFNTINVTQRKLPKALIETTKGDITEAGSPTYAQQIREITFSLCRDEDSVWGPKNGVEQINMTGVRDPNRPVTYEGLRRSTSNMFPKNLLQRLNAIDGDLPLKFAKRFWRLVAETCLEAWTGQPDTRFETDPNTGEEIEVKIKYRIKDLVGVASLAKLGKDVITSQIESSQKDKMEELITKLIDVDWDKTKASNPWMRSQAGFAGQKELYEALYRLVYSDIEPDQIRVSDTELSVG